MTSNNDQNTTNNNNRKSLTPTIGEAVKEAVETGKEVVMAGPTEAGDTTGVKDDPLKPGELDQGNKGQDKGFALSPGNSDGSKININVKDPSQDLPLAEDKIIVKPEDAKENPEEATVATITTVPAEEEGIDVEVKTELDVPLEDKDKDVESELKVKVHSPTVSKEVPLSPPQQQQILPSASVGENELTSSRFNNKEKQEHTLNLDKDKDNAQIPTGETESNSPHSQSVDEVQKQTFQVARDIANNYRDFQKQLINSFQSTFVPYFGNTNLVWDNQAYLGRLLGEYSRMVIICTENAIALNRLASDITLANIEALKNLIHNSKGKPE